MLPEPIKLVGFIVQNVLLVDRVTTLLNPSRGATVVVEVPVALRFTSMLVGLAESMKSVIVKVAVAMWTAAPLVPVIVRA